MPPSKKLSLSPMDMFSIAAGVCGMTSGLAAVLYSVFSLGAGIEANGVEIGHLKEADVRIEVKHDADNNKVDQAIENLDQKIDDRSDKIDQKLDNITNHLIRNGGS